MTRPSPVECQRIQQAVIDALNEIARDGADQQIVAETLVAHGLKIWTDVHGRQDVSRHLYLLSLKFADESKRIFGDGPTLN